MLFDEIEKAHPRVLDRFMQLLENGRLTDSRGDTVWFTEAVLVFTSNLGTHRELEPGYDGRPGSLLDINARMSRATSLNVVLHSVEDYFALQVGRPEFPAALVTILLYSTISTVTPVPRFCTNDYQHYRAG